MENRYDPDNIHSQLEISLKYGKDFATKLNLDMAMIFFPKYLPNPYPAQMIIESGYLMGSFNNNIHRISLIGLWYISSMEHRHKYGTRIRYDTYIGTGQNLKK